MEQLSVYVHVAIPTETLHSRSPSPATDNSFMRKTELQISVLGDEK